MPTLLMSMSYNFFKQIDINLDFSSPFKLAIRKYARGIFQLPFAATAIKTIDSVAGRVESSTSCPRPIIKLEIVD
jgi:hypothetical protein